jgi:hypothetical protein
MRCHAVVVSAPATAAAGGGAASASSSSASVLLSSATHDRKETRKRKHIRVSGEEDEAEEKEAGVVVSAPAIADADGAAGGAASASSPSASVLLSSATHDRKEKRKRKHICVSQEEDEVEEKETGAAEEQRTEKGNSAKRQKTEEHKEAGLARSSPVAPSIPSSSPAAAPVHPTPQLSSVKASPPVHLHNDAAVALHRYDTSQSSQLSLPFSVANLAETAPACLKHLLAAAVGTDGPLKAALTIRQRGMISTYLLGTGLHALFVLLLLRPRSLLQYQLAQPAPVVSWEEIRRQVTDCEGSHRAPHWPGDIEDYFRAELQCSKMMQTCACPHAATAAAALVRPNTTDSAGHVQVDNSVYTNAKKACHRDMTRATKMYWDQHPNHRRGRRRQSPPVVGAAWVTGPSEFALTVMDAERGTREGVQGSAEGAQGFAR